MADPFKVAVLRLLWAPGPAVADAKPHLQWPEEFFHELFQASNGWSLRDYWLRSSFGLLQVDFDFSIAKWWRFGDHTQAELKDGRAAILAAARRVVEDDNGVSLSGFDAVIAFVHAPPCNAGATPGGAVLDQGGSIQMFQHEIGHVLGFRHSFGPFLPPPNEFGSLYNDSYCVMGYTGSQSHVLQVPPQFAQTTIINPGFWRSDRRPAAASLYRRFTATADFVNSGWVAHIVPGERVWVAALSEADNTTPVIAVVPVPASQIQLTVEYRTAVGDDAGVAPAVVIHSIGAHDVGEGRDEVNPPWFETAIAPQVGNSATVLGLRIEIMTLASTRPAGVEVEVTISRGRTVGDAKKSRLLHEFADDKTQVPRRDVPVTVITDDGPHRGGIAHR